MEKNTHFEGNAICLLSDTLYIQCKNQVKCLLGIQWDIEENRTEKTDFNIVILNKRIYVFILFSDYFTQFIFLKNNEPIKMPLMLFKKAVPNLILLSISILKVKLVII